MCEFGSLKSFQDVKNFWWNEVLEHGERGAEKLLVVNKCDLPNNDKEVDLTDVKRYFYFLNKKKDGVIL